MPVYADYWVCQAFAEKRGIAIRDSVILVTFARHTAVAPWRGRLVYTGYGYEKATRPGGPGYLPSSSWRRDRDDLPSAISSRGWLRQLEMLSPYGRRWAMMTVHPTLAVVIYPDCSIW